MRGALLDDVLAALDAVPAATLRLAAQRFDDLALDAAARTPWARWGRMGTKVERLVVSSYTADLRMVGSPAGVWAWAEAGIRPHLIDRKSAGRGRHRGGAGRGRRQGRGRRTRPDVLGIVGDHPVVGPLHHPGARGFRAWTAATDALGDELDRIALDALARAGV